MVSPTQRMMLKWARKEKKGVLRVQHGQKFYDTSDAAASSIAHLHKEGYIRRIKQGVFYVEEIPRKEVNPSGPGNQATVNDY